MTNIAQFHIEHLEFLDKEGNPTQPLPPFAQDAQQMIAMYRSILLTRTLDAKAVNLQRMGKIGTYPSSLGQEAVSVGMSYAMDAHDLLVPYYRDQGAMIHRGVSMVEILNYWGGDERANNFAAPQVQEDFPIAVPVGSQCLHAAGIGYAIKYHQQKRAVVCALVWDRRGTEMAH